MTTDAMDVNSHPLAASTATNVNGTSDYQNLIAHVVVLNLLVLELWRITSRIQNVKRKR
ncbi:MAG: hypothetical protein M1831_000548 [Alyxoria varia]|nr:MAG: hypothetical protein M1831_000548 [Alyxoria varia]